MTLVLVLALGVAFVLALVALRDLRSVRHDVERRVMTYAGQHEWRLFVRLDGMRRRSEGGRRHRGLVLESPAIGQQATGRTRSRLQA